MNKRPGIKVFAPATVGNLAVGFDIMGLAINGPGDELLIREGDKAGLHIVSIHGDNGKLPREAIKNTAGFAALKVLEANGIKDYAIEMELYKKMPFGSGMGSSAASAVVGAFGMNEFLGVPFTKKELIPFAVQGEQLASGSLHADNVAPSLLGGITLIRDNESFDIINLPAPRGLQIVLIYPHVKILTKDARNILSDKIELKQHIIQNGNTAAFVAALYKFDLDLIKRSLQDTIIEPQRAQLIPHFYNMKEAAIDAGALGRPYMLKTR